MSRTINRIELLGRVGTEPELRQTRNGTAPGSGPGQAVCRLWLATDRRNAGGGTTSWSGARPPRRSPSTSRRAIGSTPRVGSATTAGRTRTASAARRPRSTRTRSSSSTRNSLPPTRAGGSGNGRQSDGDQPFSPDHTISRLCRGARRGRAPTGDAAPLRSHHLKGTRDDRTDRIHRAERRAAGAARRPAPQPQLLGELAIRYEVETRPERPLDMPTIKRPETVVDLLGEEMSRLAQEQVRVVCSTARTASSASARSTRATATARWSARPRSSGPPWSRRRRRPSSFTITPQATPSRAARTSSSPGTWSRWRPWHRTARPR